MCFVATSASGQERDCDNAQTQTDMNICAGLALDAADAELNATYQDVMADLKTNQPGVALALRDAQRAWIPFRDAACHAEALRYEGGSIQPLIHASCLEKLTRQRTNDIRLGFEKY
ncbi:lysozyme inhibitor LprI family protein [Celeribacter arenosi]|uniref:Lysozyme inhibitor LprI family protein n=1 Tax=Celeribacter arenosi TaxID=792649 RepID=A0ABP7KCG8_9RHOB